MDYEHEESKYLLHTYKRNYVNFVDGNGAKLYDENGKEYIDFMAGIAVSSVGYKNEALVNAVSSAINGVHHISNLFYIDSQVKAAKKIKELSRMEIRVFFGNSGAEANEGAIKIARKYGETNFEKKRYKIITIKNSFHGRTITTLKATAQDRFHDFFGPYPEGFLYADTIDEALSAMDDETAAIMLEPIQAEGGVFAFPKHELEKLREETRQKGVLLIFDEIQSGVFRSGEFLACQIFGVEPDVFTLAKGLAGGVPIGAVGTTLKDIFVPGEHGSTFGGNPLSTKAAVAVLGVLEAEYKSGKLAEIIDSFEKQLFSIVADYPHLFEKSSGLGLLRGLKAKSEEIMQKVISEAFKEGVLVIKSAQNTVRFLPPLTIKEEEISEGFTRLRRAIDGI
jgi:acetylornithine/N-succinyldiaminopimelate aminotransferase